MKDLPKFEGCSTIDFVHPHTNFHNYIQNANKYLR